jgi:hypothetical protein
MSDPVLIAIITGAASAIPALIVGLLTNRKIEEVRHATNSMKDELVRGALIEGHVAGVSDQKLKEAEAAVLKVVEVVEVPPHPPK